MVSHYTPPQPFRKVKDTAEQTITLGGRLTIAHNLGGIPKDWKAVFRCKTANLNWAVGDEVDTKNAQYTQGSSSDCGVWIGADETNFYVYFGGTNAPLVSNKTTGSATSITVGSWKLVIRGYI